MSNTLKPEFLRNEIFGNTREDEVRADFTRQEVNHFFKHTLPEAGYAKHEKQFSLVIDIQKKLTEGKGKGYEQWAKRSNAKQMAEVILFLQDEHIDSYDELVLRAENASAHYRDLSDEIKACEKRMDEISILKRHIINYVKTKDVYAEYRKHGYSRKFFEARREELTLHKAAKEAFSQSGLQKIPKVRELNDEFQELLARKKTAYSEYHHSRDVMKKYNLARKNVEAFLQIDPQEKDDKIDRVVEKTF